jgi:hypothetical protein
MQRASCLAELTGYSRKAALRSVEANKRLAAASLDVKLANLEAERTHEKPDQTSEYAEIKLDASKALTEAKIEADSPDDKKVYALLKAEYELTPIGSESDKDYKRYSIGTARCRVEVLTIIDPDEVNEKFRKAVGDVGCLAIKAAMDKEAAAIFDSDRK